MVFEKSKLQMHIDYSNLSNGSSIKFQIITCEINEQCKINERVTTEHEFPD